MEEGEEAELSDDLENMEEVRLWCRVAGRTSPQATILVLFPQVVYYTACASPEVSYYGRTLYR